MSRLVKRWVIGAGGFTGEVSLQELLPDDSGAKREGVRCVELTDFHVHPLRRGRGWGATLLGEALRHADRYGWDVFLRVVPYGKGGGLDVGQLRQLYHRYGFRRLRRNDDRELVRRSLK